MFEELRRTLRKLEGESTVSVSIPTDAEGYFDRECPSEECLFHFKILEDDWKDKVSDEKVYCPFCGHTADSDKWWTQEQIEHAKQAAFAQIGATVNRAMRKDADRWNRQQPRNSFIKMTMHVDNKPKLVSLPIAAAEPMKLKITCPQCECHYAVIGAAYFCPACGHNAADQQFKQTTNGIRKSLDSIDAVRTAIEDRDTAENTVRTIIENGLQSAVTAFQRYAEALYSRFSGVPMARRNAFQNLSEGSDLWNVATGKRFSNILTQAELEFLTRAFQQRHLIAHTQGLVDEDYLKRSNDTQYRVGQRLVVRKSLVLETVDHLEKLASAMEKDAPRA